jgi:hypothetical protein
LLLLSDKKKKRFFVRKRKCLIREELMVFSVLLHLNK